MKEDILVFEDNDGTKFHDLKTPKKVRLGVKTRLEIMAPYIDKWP